MPSAAFYKGKMTMRYLDFANRIQANKTAETLLTLIDLSPSMEDDDWKPSRKAGAIRANIELIKLKAQHHPRDVAGVIGFGSYEATLTTILKRTTQPRVQYVTSPLRARTVIAGNFLLVGS